MTNEETQAKEQDVQKTTKTTPETSNDDGDQPKNDSPIFAANSAAERLERANKEMRENLKLQQELYAQQKLGGQSQGRPQEKKPEEVDPAKYAQDALEGKIPPKE